MKAKTKKPSVSSVKKEPKFQLTVMIEAKKGKRRPGDLQLDFFTGAMSEKDARSVLKLANELNHGKKHE